MSFDFGKEKLNNMVPYVHREAVSMFIGMAALVGAEPQMTDCGYCMDAPDLLPTGGAACIGGPTWIGRPQ